MRYADYIENKQRGTPYFPLEYYFVDKMHPQYVMPLHWHNDFEIIRVQKGVCKFFLENIEYKLFAGDVLLVPPGYLHRGEPDDSIYDCIVFDLNMLIKHQNDVSQKLISPIINSTVSINKLLFLKDSELAKAVESLFKILREKQPYYELESYSLFFKIFALLYSQDIIVSSKEFHHTRQAKTISSLIDWIEINLNQNITLEMLSQISGFSQKYLCRIFKDYTSKTLINYINELRIERACYDMAVKGKSVTNAAFDNGFNDLSYFCKTFKRHIGTTPNKYKKNLTDFNVHQ